MEPALGMYSTSPASASQLLRPFFYAGCFLQCADAVTTYLALTFHSGPKETNGAMFALIDSVGLGPAMVAKFVIGCTLFWVLACIGDTGRHRLAWLNRGPGFSRSDTGRISVSWAEKAPWRIQRSAATTMAFGLVVCGAVVGNNLRVIASQW